MSCKVKCENACSQTLSEFRYDPIFLSAVKKDLDEKAAEFFEKGSEVYAKA